MYHKCTHTCEKPYVWNFEGCDFWELAFSRPSLHKPMALNIVLKLVCLSLSPSSTPVPQFGGL